MIGAAPPSHPYERGGGMRCLVFVARNCRDGRKAPPDLLGRRGGAGNSSNDRRVPVVPVRGESVSSTCIELINSNYLPLGQGADTGADRRSGGGGGRPRSTALIHRSLSGSIGPVFPNRLDIVRTSLGNL